MLYREIIAVCSELPTKHTNTLCGPNVKSVKVKLGGAYSDHWDLNVFKPLCHSTLRHYVPQCCHFITLYDVPNVCPNFNSRAKMIDMQRD